MLTKEKEKDIKSSKGINCHTGFIVILSLYFEQYFQHTNKQNNI